MEKRGTHVIKNIVRVALTVVKSKCAAKHFETQIASHISTGSDMGEIGHSRKQFNGILRATEIYLDNQIEEYLLTPLKNTLLPPHFCGLADKSTVHRITNQCVVITTMVNGLKTAIAVQAPAVYHIADEEQPSAGITGANAPELADAMFQALKAAYPKLADKLQTSWQGSVLDGQYQAKGFMEKLKVLLQKPASEFFDIVWDPPHWVNLAIEDVMDGKIGNSKGFLKRLIGKYIQCKYY